MKAFHTSLFLLACFKALTPCASLRICAFLRLDQGRVIDGMHHVEAAFNTWAAPDREQNTDMNLLVAVVYSFVSMTSLGVHEAYKNHSARVQAFKHGEQEIRILNRMVRHALWQSCQWLLSLGPDTYVNILALQQRLKMYNESHRWILAAPSNHSTNHDDMYLISQGLMADSLTAALHACAKSGAYHVKLFRSEPSMLANCLNSQEKQAPDHVHVLDFGVPWHEFIPDWHLVGRLLKQNHQRMSIIRPGRRLRMHRCLMAVQAVVDPRDFYWIHRRIQSYPRHVLPTIDGLLDSYDRYSLARLNALSSVETCLLDPLEILASLHYLHQQETTSTAELWFSQWRATYMENAQNQLDKKCTWSFFSAQCVRLFQVPSIASYEDCILVCCKSMHCNTFSYHEEHGCWIGPAGCMGFQAPGWQSGITNRAYLEVQDMTPQDWVPKIEPGNMTQFGSASRAEVLERAAMHEKEMFFDAVVKLASAEQTDQDRGTRRETVSCLFTVDNAIVDVFYDGQNLTQEVSGVFGDWTSIKQVSFQTVTGGVLAIGGYNYEETTGKQTCDTAGLLFGCISSDPDSGWQNLASSTQNIKTFGASTASPPMKWFLNGFNDSMWDNPCESASFFEGSVGSHPAQKIWGGNKWSFFRIRPSEHSMAVDKLAASAVFHAKRSQSFGWAAVSHKMFATDGLVLAISPWRYAYQKLSLSRGLKKAMEQRLFQASLNFTKLHIAGSMYGWLVFCTMASYEGGQCLRLAMSQTMVELKDLDTVRDQQLLLAHVQRTPFLRWLLGWESHTVNPKYYIPGDFHDDLEKLQDPGSIYGQQVRNLIGTLEQNWESFSAECLTYYNKMSLAPWPTLFSEEDDWRLTVLYSTAAGWNQKLCEGFPVTCDVLQRIFPFKRDWEHEVSRIAQEFFSSEEEVGFFALTPGSKVRTHNGGSNARLNIHVGLAGVEGARLVLPQGDVKWQLGKALVFNDGMDHSVLHEGAETRFVFFVRLRHPHVTYLDYAKLRAQDILVDNTLKHAKHAW